MRIVQLGTRCNNACIFCAAEAERTPPADTSAEAVEAAIDSVPEGETLAFVGGEPTLHEPLAGWATRARTRGVRVLVQTNGRRLAYGAYARSLAEAGVEGLDVSLHGSTAPMHDYHTSVEGSFRQTVRGCANAAGAGVGVWVTCVVTRSNFRHLAEIVRVARAAGARAIRFQAPKLTGRATAVRDRVVAHPELVLPYLRRAVTAGQRYGLEVVTGALPAEAGFVPYVADQAAPARPLGRSGAQEPFAGRANPGRNEQRVRERRTGAELRDILPDLFEPEPESR